MVLYQHDVSVVRPGICRRTLTGLGDRSYPSQKILGPLHEAGRGTVAQPPLAVSKSSSAQSRATGPQVRNQSRPDARVFSVFGIISRNLPPPTHWITRNSRGRSQACRFLTMAIDPATAHPILVILQLHTMRDSSLNIERSHI